MQHDGAGIGHSAVASPKGACTHAFALLEVSVPLAPSTLDTLAVLYSFVPWAGCLVLAMVVVRKQRDEVYAARILALLLTAMLAINELILKKVLQEPRPERSCLRSHGMPSSHSLLSIGVLSYVALELLWGDCTLNGFRHRTRRDATGLFLSLFALLAPVPFSRVHLHDHHGSQVVMGSALGVVLACLFFCSHYVWAKKRRRRRSSSSR
jgi:membrane-associated phospholipid phosphatase